MAPSKPEMSGQDDTATNLRAAPDTGALVGSRVVKPRGHLGLVWRRFGRNRLGVIGGVGLVLLCLLSLLAPWLTPYDYSGLDLTSASRGPSLAHPMGTDLLGRDELTRVLYGGRISLGMGLAVGALSTTVGATVGIISGYYGRKLDAGATALADLVLALPLVPLALVTGFRFGFSPLVVTLVLALLLWPRMARMVRAEVLSVRQQEYVEAARALGVSGGRIVARHVLPGVAGIVAVEGTLSVAAAILLESALSYLSVFMCDLNTNCFLAPGVESGVHSWGRLIGEARLSMPDQWWLTLFPGLMMTLSILYVNFLGDALRDALDPKTGG